MAITRTTDTDDDGTGTTGTIHNNAWLQAIYAAIESNWLTDSYTPAITGSGSNPTVSAATGAYIKIGKLIVFRASLTINGVGAGNYSVSLPATAVSAGIPGLIKVFTQDVSAGSAIYNGVGYIFTTTTFALLTDDATLAANWTPTVPITFAAGDLIHVFGAYFAA